MPKEEGNWIKLEIPVVFNEIQYLFPALSNKVLVMLLLNGLEIVSVE